MKMTKIITMAGCAVSLLAPTKANALWFPILDLDGDRDRAMMAAINRGIGDLVNMNKELERSGTISQATLQRMENDNAELGSIASFADNGSVVTADIALVNNTQLTVSNVRLVPRIAYGGAKLLDVSGSLGPRGAARLPSVGANAYYSVSIEVEGGNTLNFGDMFVGAGRHYLVLAQDCWGQCRLSLM